MRVLSEKDRESDIEEIVVVVTGSKTMKVKAACIITEKIATFRYATKAKTFFIIV